MANGCWDHLGAVEATYWINPLAVEDPLTVKTSCREKLPVCGLFTKSLFSSR
jgi:hypothetical protein